MAAAFGRLCVETLKIPIICNGLGQPPSGGCVLKLASDTAYAVMQMQPPSGGCVLKLMSYLTSPSPPVAAAFGRLCVETLVNGFFISSLAGSRLRAAVC